MMAYGRRQLKPVTESLGHLVANWWVVSDGKGETESDAGENTPSLPDISDIEGATTGPLRRPGAAAASTPSEWAAPSIEDLKEPATELATTAADDAAEAVGEPTQQFDVITPDEPANDDPQAGDSRPNEITADAVTGDETPPSSPDPTATIPAGGAGAAGATIPAGGAGEADRAGSAEATVESAVKPPANPTVSIDAKQVGMGGGGPSRAVTTAAAVPLALSGDDATAPNLVPDRAAEVADQLTVANEQPTIVATPPDETDRLATAGPDGDGDGIANGRSGKRRGRKLARILFLGVLGLLVLFVGAWLLDSARTSNQVLRNTSLGSIPIGGLDRDELGAIVDDLDGGLASAPLTVTVDDVPIETTPRNPRGQTRSRVVDR